MRYRTAALLFALTSTSAFAFAPQPSSADVSVARIAQTHGLRLAWLDPQDAVGLSGAGLRVVLRPGDRLVEINGRLETAPAAPYLHDHQMFVSDAFARRLDALASAPAAASASLVAQAPNPAVPPRAITLAVKPVVGAEALAISGTAAAGNAVQLTLFATFSRDVPDVVLSRQTVLPDAGGAFAATMPIAPGFFREAVITVVATPSTGPSASARVTVGAPNVTVPPDNAPRNR